MKKLIEHHVSTAPLETEYLFSSLDSTGKFAPLKIGNLDNLLSYSAELLREKISLASIGRSAAIYLTAHGNLDDEFMALIRGYVPQTLGSQGHYINFSSGFSAENYDAAYQLIWERLKQKSRQITQFLKLPLITEFEDFCNSLPDCPQSKNDSGLSAVVLRTGSSCVPVIPKLRDYLANLKSLADFADNQISRFDCATARAALTLMALTGMRATEVQDLTVKIFYIEDAESSIAVKGKDNRRFDEWSFSFLPFPFGTLLRDYQSQATNILKHLVNAAGAFPNRISIERGDSAFFFRYRFCAHRSAHFQNLEAQIELERLKQVKGIPTWEKVFTAYLRHCLNSFTDAKIADGQNDKLEVNELTEPALNCLYNFEPPFTLEVRRGKLNYASLSDSQFNAFLPLKEKLKKKKAKVLIDGDAEELEYYYTGNLTDDEDGEDFGQDNDAAEQFQTARELASDEVRKFLDYIVDNDTTYTTAIVLAERLVKEELFTEDAAGDVRLLMLRLIDRLRRKKKKGNRVSSLHTYSQRLLYLIDEFEGVRFADLKLEDFILFLRQYATANAARAYRSVAWAFHKFLKEELKLPVSEINRDSPLLQFSAGYRERELITENEFKELLRNAGRSSLLGESQMQIVLLLLRRAGLRCGEAARKSGKSLNFINNLPS